MTMGSCRIIAVVAIKMHSNHVRTVAVQVLKNKNNFSEKGCTKFDFLQITRLQQCVQNHILTHFLRVNHAVRYQFLAMDLLWMFIVTAARNRVSSIWSCWNLLKIVLWTKRGYRIFFLEIRAVLTAKQYCITVPSHSKHIFMRSLLN